MHSNHLHRDRTIVYNCKYHVVFCPKYRRSVLVPPIDSRIKELVLEKQDTYGYSIVEMEVMEDHVHLLLEIDTVVCKIKGYTAHRIRQEYPWMKHRMPSLWTRSRFITSVGAVSLEVVKSYIEEQKGA